WAKAAAATFAERGGIFVTVQDTGGQFGLGGTLPRERAFLGGIAGLAKTAAQEWSKVVVKAVDLARDGRPAGELALVLADELLAGGP
ncbi:hypothetical protein OVW19_28970, partial [Klebsiella pneumoniae]|uniref:hypothetical protein n=1 Tax=Klebsiella pneumoniae TaxID=573 RepID=UPI00226FA5D8